MSAISTLKGLSDSELKDRITSLVGREKELIHEIVLHFSEFDSRRLYAELGYSSLFDYATRGLGYSPSAAQRRIKAAGALSVFPEIYELRCSVIRQSRTRH